jgi:hypothetical protein
MLACADSLTLVSNLVEFQISIGINVNALEIPAKTHSLLLSVTQSNS